MANTSTDDGVGGG